MLRLYQTLNYFSRKKIKDKNVYQRRKYYSKYPQIFKLQTRIRPPDLTQPDIPFPISIPIRYRHIYSPTKPLFIDTTKTIHWNRLSPNQILLAFQNTAYLKINQLTQGLQYLSKVQGQQKFNWNEHPWVKSAMDKVNNRYHDIKKGQHIQYYYLMKKLRYQNQQFWQRTYQKIEGGLYELYPSDFEYIYLTYYKNPSVYFSQNFKVAANKLMQGRIRQFKGTSILKIFQSFIEDNKLDTYWVQNVFMPLFKNKQYKYTNQQICKILRGMMMINYEKNQRFYQAIYSSIMQKKYTQQQDVQFLIDVIQQVQQIFKTHRVEDLLQFLYAEKLRIENTVKVQKKTLPEIVREDLIMFMQRRRLKKQNIA